MNGVSLCVFERHISYALILPYYRII